MADAVGLLILLVLLIALAVAIGHFYNKTRTSHPGDTVSIWATNPNERPIQIGSAKVEDADFMDRIERIRSEGYMKLAALNSGRKEKTWRLEEHTGE